MPDAYTGEIRPFAGNFVPQDWLLCDGSLQRIDEYGLLYTLLGTTYGGDGNATFGLPNMASRVVVGQGQGPGLSSYQLGEKLGTESVTLLADNTTKHQHPITGSLSVVTGATSATANPSGAYFGDKGAKAYGPADGTATMASLAMSGTMDVAGGTNVYGDAAPHTNVQPITAMYYIICANGIYPSRPTQG